MPHHPFATSSRADLLWGGVFLLAAIGCSDERSSAGPTTAIPLPDDVSAGQDSPLDFSYVCGNRFLVYSTYSVPISVTYRVAESGEEGTVEVPAAPAIDPAASEKFFETSTRGVVQIFLKGKPIVARANGGSVCTPAPPPAAGAMAGGQAMASSWSGKFDWGSPPIVAVHMMLLPNGRVLSIGRTGTPHVWNPACGTLPGCFTQVSPPAWLFCSGHALLSDGRVLVAGGHIKDRFGLPNISLFSHSSTGGTWASGTKMARGRWYPTATTMGNGDVAIIAGSDENDTHVPIPEVWRNGALRQLTTASKTLVWYPRAFLAPNGSLYVAGGTIQTFFLSLAGTGSWSNGPRHLHTESRSYGSAVMYDEGKILYTGGALSPVTNTAEKIDLTVAAPAWSWTNPMHFARRHHNATVLPTGEVLVTGGVGGDGEADPNDFNDLDVPVRAAELWNPATGTWTVLASNNVTRGYHGSSLLLPDGRVLNAGSGEGAGAVFTEKNAELFTPPYLLRGARPTISSAPTEARYGTTFQVNTPQAATVTRVTLIRLGAVTHAFDQNQRFQKLSFTKNATGVAVVTPGSSLSNRTPPGHYMLFILTGSGSTEVPSVAKIIRIF